ncbi:MAG: hypothetical protein NZ695_08335 [Dehalococcoidia bacterium]|nr:hypothetical protein [Dehalococcoidia bacterium]
MPYRRRQRLEGRISLPAVALHYAAEQGATAIIVRLDSERLAYRLPLAEALRIGSPGTVDGQAEIWLRLDDFTEVGWPDWPFATREVKLGPGPESFPRQLALMAEVAG